jgi:carbamoyl-phosphate synthase large subunit
VKVLVTGAGALLGQGIIRALRSSSIDVEIVAVDASVLSAGLYWADAAYLIPMANDPGYIAHIDELLRREKPDAVLVGTDTEQSIIAAHRHQLERAHKTHVLVSDPQVVKIADDKYLTYQFMKHHGFDPPDSCLPGDEERLIGRVGFPLIVKPRHGARSVGVHVAYDRAELDGLLRLSDGLMIQECAGSMNEEYTAGVLYFDGRCEASIVMRRDLRDGNTYRAYVEEFPDLNKVVREMGCALKPYGPANFQFRLDAGRIRVFEINTRFSGTTPLRHLAGFNEVELCLRRVVLGEPILQPAIEPMVILRHWSETVVRLDQLAKGWQVMEGGSSRRLVFLPRTLIKGTPLKSFFMILPFALP